MTEVADDNAHGNDLDDTIFSDTSGEQKYDEDAQRLSLQPIYEMELERQRTILFFTSFWTSDIIVKINQETNSLIIENDKHFMDKMADEQKPELPLNECTISMDLEPIGDGDKTIQYLNIAHNLLAPHFRFRLPEIKQQDERERLKFTMFAATLNECGSQFNKLKALLLKWNHDRNEEAKDEESALTNHIIDTFITGFSYEQFQNRHQLTQYINLITNMDNKMIKAVETILELKEFCKEDERWQERSNAVLKLQNEWALLLPTIRVKIKIMFTYVILCKCHTKYENMCTQHTI